MTTAVSAAQTVITAARERFPGASEDTVVAYCTGFLEALQLVGQRERFARGFAGELVRQVQATDPEEWREWSAWFVRLYGALYAEESSRAGLDSSAAAVDSDAASSGVAPGGTG